MKIGIIGAGNISDTHARAAESLPGVEVVAVYGGNREKAARLAERHHAALYETLDDLLDHRALGAVFIGSPSGCHAAEAMAAVSRGLHVLVEKPLDIATARIDALIEAVDRGGVTLGVFFQDRLKPDLVTVKRLLSEGVIGVPAIASGEVKWYRPPEYYTSSRWRGTWALDGGGALMNQGIHTVDLLLHLLGPVRRVAGSIATRFHPIEAEDTAAATLEFASGVVATIQATTAAYPGLPRRVHILGSAGSLLVEGDRLAEVTSQASAKVPAIEPPPASAPENASSPVVSDVTPHRRIIEDFLDAIANKRRPICDAVEGRRSVAVVEAVYQSARSGRSVDL